MLKYSFRKFCSLARMHECTASVRTTKMFDTTKFYLWTMQKYQIKENTPSGPTNCFTIDRASIPFAWILQRIVRVCWFSSSCLSQFYVRRRNVTLKACRIIENAAHTAFTYIHKGRKQMKWGARHSVRAHTTSSAASLVHWSCRHILIRIRVNGWETISYSASAMTTNGKCFGWQLDLALVHVLHFTHTVRSHTCVFAFRKYNSLFNYNGFVKDVR